MNGPIASKTITTGGLTESIQGAFLDQVIKETAPEDTYYIRPSYKEWKS